MVNPIETNTGHSVCEFTADDLSIEKSLLESYNIASWECSRPVWGQAEEQHCVWHADLKKKPQKKLKSTILDGDLHGAFVPSDTDLNGTTFPAEAGLIGSDLSDVTLGIVDLSKADLRYADLSGATLGGSDLSGSTISHADLSDADLRDADLSNAFLSNTDLSGANLGCANLSSANLISANLSNADLGDYSRADVDYAGADLSDALLWHTNLSNALLSDANLSGAFLRDANLSGANLESANLSEASLRGANLSNTIFSDAKLVNTNLEKATLLDVDLFDAELTNITPYGARLEAVQINDGTEFHANKSEYKRWWQRGPLGPPPRCGYDPKVDQPEHIAEDERAELLTKAADTYRQFEEIARQNTQPSLQSSMFVLRQDMQRKRYRERKEYVQAFANRLFRLVFKHGESFSRILLTAATTILLFAGAYWQADLILANPNAPLSDQVYIDNIIDALYFSTLTFTTLGLSDFQPGPTAQLGRALVLLEAVIGAVLIATFVFVLGRRAAR